MNRKQYTTSEWERKDIALLSAGMAAIGIFIGVCICCAVLMILTMQDAEAEEMESRWVICQPGSWVNIREKPNRHANESGYLELGDRFETDGTVKNGFIHVIGKTEFGEGWVSVAYLAKEEPVIGAWTARVNSRARVAVRKTPGGKRTGWLKNGDRLTVYAYADGWAVTPRGFVALEWLEDDP